MPITARERAQKALDKLNADVEKARAKHDKLAAKREAATAASGAAALDLHALIAERDHLASHPALRDSEPVDETFAVVAEAEPQAEPVQAAEPEPSFVPGQPHLGTPAAQAEPVATSAASAFDPFAKDPFAPSACAIPPPSAAPVASGDRGCSGSTDKENPHMQDGTFIYPRWDDGAPQHLRVRECPDPAKTRALIESLTGPTRWEPKR